MRPACTCSAPSSWTASRRTPQDDLDFFTFPALDATIGTDALDAPIDGFCASAAGKNQEAAKAYLAWLGTAEAADAGNNARDRAVHRGQRRCEHVDVRRPPEEVGRGGRSTAKSIAQFLDRDTNADFAYTVIIPSLQDFLKNPNDIDGDHRVDPAAGRRPSSADPDERKRRSWPTDRHRGSLRPATTSGAAEGAASRHT